MFQRLGRIGDYDPVRQVGNPCSSASIAALKHAYAAQQWQLGYAECSAVSLSFDKYQQLQQALHTEVTAAWQKGSTQEALLLQRDQLAFSLCWGAAVRAENAGALQLKEVQDRRGQPLGPLLLQPAFPFPEGFQWQLAPDGTKVARRRRAGVVPMTVLPPAEAYRDALRLLHQYIQACPTCHLSTSGYLLHAQTPDGQGFKQEPWSTSSLNKRLQHHLHRLGLFAGESSHGLRRGTAIHDHQQLGSTPAAIGDRLLHADPGGVQTKRYLDTSRETERPVRQRR
ncbi:hypothetical protein ABPG75_004238 [Micractinium tetrahymenae]